MATVLKLAEEYDNLKEYQISQTKYYKILENTFEKLTKRIENFDEKMILDF